MARKGFIRTYIYVCIYLLRMRRESSLVQCARANIHIYIYTHLLFLSIARTQIYQSYRHTCTYTSTDIFSSVRLRFGQCPLEWRPLDAPLSPVVYRCLCRIPPAPLSSTDRRRASRRRRRPRFTSAWPAPTRPLLWQLGCH